MDRKSVLAEIQAWPVAERLQLIEEVWEGLPPAEVGDDVPEELRALLDERLADAEANPDDVFTVDEVIAYARRPR